MRKRTCAVELVVCSAFVYTRGQDTIHETYISTVNRTLDEC
jgi:hypothetical protein